MHRGFEKQLGSGGNAGARLLLSGRKIRRLVSWPEADWRR